MIGPVIDHFRVVRSFSLRYRWYVVHALDMKALNINYLLLYLLTAMDTSSGSQILLALNLVETRIAVRRG